MTVRARVAWWVVFAAIFGAVGLSTVSATAHGQAVDGYYEVTAYACPPYCGRTASGAWVGPGSIAAPAWLPFGVDLVVDGWYAGTVTDRGSAIYGRRLDIWLPSHWDAVQWGRRWVWVEWIRAGASDAPPPPSDEDASPSLDDEDHFDRNARPQDHEDRAEPDSIDSDSSHPLEREPETT